MKELTKNEYHKSVNRVVDYINQHLDEPVDLKTLAGIANISEFHFHRIFKAFVGESIGSYISRLKLEYAAGKLQLSGNTLSEIAEKTGYRSEFSLSKAFRKHFGINPSAFRNTETYFSSHFQQPNYDIPELNPEYMELQDRDLLYIRIISKYGSSSDYDKAWSKLLKYASLKNLLKADSEFIGLSFDDPNITASEKCRFYACISVDTPVDPEGEFGLQRIDGGKYAVFTLKGPYSGLNALYQAVYFHWLPRTNAELRHGMPFEKYLNNPDEVEPSDLITEVYLPVQ
ncbi:AraC family transcriptional regulator [Marinilabilia rubra]|uniref:AraC family transcriptional regulator n=1 Tax=Marinilabilia rubra TaxID=2162893 RepID=A0A2U2B478_9BACT|nr:AraC family transcriptional regulator [Marinilabilia rubra]PWD97870.1 AraC family transcriptional regulator [Marinilabilia rubra]